MFLCFLLGRMGMALTVGLLDVFVLQADIISAQGFASAGLDLIVAAARRHCAAPAEAGTAPVDLHRIPDATARRGTGVVIVLLSLVWAVVSWRRYVARVRPARSRAGTKTAKGTKHQLGQTRQARMMARMEERWRRLYGARTAPPVLTWASTRPARIR